VRHRAQTEAHNPEAGAATAAAPAAAAAAGGGAAAAAAPVAIKPALNMGVSAVVAGPGIPSGDTYYTGANALVHVPNPIPPKTVLMGLPQRAITNYYPYHSYLPAYRSAYFYSPWLHDPFGLRPFNHYARAHRVVSKNVAPFNTYRWPFRMAPFPLVTADHASQWGYPGYYPGVPAVRGFPGAGAPGVPHPAYPFMTPVSRMGGAADRMGVEHVYQ